MVVTPYKNFRISLRYAIMFFFSSIIIFLFSLTLILFNLSRPIQFPIHYKCSDDLVHVIVKFFS